MATLKTLGASVKQDFFGKKVIGVFKGMEIKPIPAKGDRPATNLFIMKYVSPDIVDQMLDVVLGAGSINIDMLSKCLKAMNKGEGVDPMEVDIPTFDKDKQIKPDCQIQVLLSIGERKLTKWKDKVTGEERETYSKFYEVVNVEPLAAMQEATPFNTL